MANSIRLKRILVAFFVVFGDFNLSGGLVAPESDDNPWNYKFSWAPKNVVLAGSFHWTQISLTSRSRWLSLPGPW